MGKSAPPPPDYKGAAEAESQASRENIERQIWANRPNRVNPWGTETWANEQVWDPTTQQYLNQWTQKTELSPELQRALDAQLGLQTGRSELAGGMMQDIRDMMGREMDWSQFGGLQGVDPQARMTGAGQGLQNAGPINLNAGGYQRQNLNTNMNFNDPGLNSRELQRDLDYSGASAVNAPEWTQQAAERSIYDRGASRLDPQMAQEAQALDVRLRSQGLNPGDEAYDAQMRNFQDRKTDAYQALQNEAIKGGSEAAQRMFGMQLDRRNMMTGETDRQGEFHNAALLGMFGMDAQKQAQAFDIASGQANFANQAKLAQMQSDLAAMLGRGGLQAQEAGLNLQALGMNNQNQMNAWNQMLQQGSYNQDLAFREADYANQLRQTAINEEMARRGQRLNEVNALISGQQVSAPQFNSFNQAGLAQTPQYLQAAGMLGQHQQANFSAEQAMWNSLMGGLGQGAGMLAMSDRRLKRNVRTLGQINGVNWYAFDYLWGEPAIGVMADEVPWAAVPHPSGYLMVDYSKV